MSSMTSVRGAGQPAGGPAAPVKIGAVSAGAAAVGTAGALIWQRIAHQGSAVPRALAIGAVVGGAVAGAMLLSEYRADPRRSTLEKHAATGALAVVAGAGLIATAKLGKRPLTAVAELPTPVRQGLPYPFDARPLPTLNSRARSHILGGGGYTSEQGVKFSGGHRHGTGL
ncbi:MAG: hypothetical protein JWM90_2792, partial [Thermoleophilia bacterium]|nr:hypothetical protein [Thermoleophilia bacterium]